MRDSLSYQIEELGLDCPALEGNQMFTNLRNRLRHFFFQQEDHRRSKSPFSRTVQPSKTTVDFSFKLELHRGLKRLLREVIVIREKSMQLRYLAKVYAWYFRKLESVGLLSNTEKDEEDMLLNPAKIEEIEQRKREKKEVARLELMDEANIEASERGKFEKRERTVHKEIPPAKDRVNDYKRKCFGRLFNGL